MSDTLSLGEIHPFVRYAQLLSVDASDRFAYLIAYDHRLFYCISGRGVIEVEDVAYPMERGCVLLWNSALRYHLRSESSDMRLIGFSFDYTNTHASLSMPIPPAKWDFFNPAQVVEPLTVSNPPFFAKPLYLTGMRSLEAQMDEIRREYALKLNLHALRASSLLSSVLVLLAREKNSRSSKKSAREDSLAVEVIEYIQNHYAEELSNARLGEAFHFHPNYINRLMVRHTGFSLHRYLLHRRIEAAMDLLQNTDLSAGHIASEVGFRDFGHFIKLFKRTTGRTTGEFRLRQNAGAPNEP